MSSGPPYTDAITIERRPGQSEYIVITDVKPFSRVTYMEMQRRRIWYRRYVRECWGWLRHPWLSFVDWAIRR